jgi:hypothetical protein
METGFPGGSGALHGKLVKEFVHVGVRIPPGPGIAGGVDSRCTVKGIDLKA